MSKCYMAILSLSVAALLLYQCFDLLLVQDNTIKPVKHCQQTKHETLHDKKYGYFLQITDTHLDDHYTDGATLKSGCHKYPRKHLHSKHHELCNTMGVPGVRMDAPVILIEHTLDWIRREWRDKLDFVIWTGDNARHDWDLAHPRKETKVLELSKKVTDMMLDVFGASPEHPREIPVVPVIGNNDVQPHNYIDLNDDVLYFFAKLWKHWIPENQRKDYLEGGYFAVDVAPGLRVLSINTMYFLHKNPYATACRKKSSIGHAHMKWYKKQLAKARKDNVKVYVIGHVPPSPRDFFKTCLSEYMSITSDYSDIVFGHFYGHLNMDHFLMYDRREQEIHARDESMDEIHNQTAWEVPFLEDSMEDAPDQQVTIQRNVKEYVNWLKHMYDEIDEFENNHPHKTNQQVPFNNKQFNSEPVVVVHIAPSVFPVYMPTVRIYRYEYRKEEATHEYGTLLGYSQYVANISEYNEQDGHKDPKPPLEYKLEYDTKELYGLTDLSIDSYIEFADALTQKDETSQNLWKLFCKNIFMQTLNSTFDQ